MEQIAIPPAPKQAKASSLLSSSSSSSYSSTRRRKQQQQQQQQQASPPAATGGKGQRVTTAASAAAAAVAVAVVPKLEKTDTHYDFLLKEMQWLAADFQSERKKHGTYRRRVTNSIKQYHKSKEARRSRDLLDAQNKRRKLAAKVGREVKGWWKKIERVVSYKQKLSADRERQNAMNKQLVTLVKQTEKYSEAMTIGQEEENNSSSSSSSSSSDNDCNSSSTQRKKKKKKKRRRRKYRRLTIEEALAEAGGGGKDQQNNHYHYLHQHRRRKAREVVTDYARFNIQIMENSNNNSNRRRRNGTTGEQQQEENSLYGYSTASDGSTDGGGGSDSSYEPRGGKDFWVDDETTLRQAEQEEILERRRRRRRRRKFVAADDNDNASGGNNSSAAGGGVGGGNSGDYYEDDDEDDDASFVADPEELRKLQQEAEMDIDQVLERLRNEVVPTSSLDAANTAAATENMDVDDSGTEREESTRKRVKFSTSVQVGAPAKTTVPVLESERQQSLDSGNDADDDGDASDVEDFVGDVTMKDASDDGNDSDEFVADEKERDDETTMEQEEQLPQEMSAKEEIKLLKEENEMSVEELRKKYAALYQEQSPQGDVDERKNITSWEESPFDDLLNINDSAEEDEFRPEVGTGVDDETTIEAEEKMGRDMSYKEEINLLQNESEIPIERLREMYAAALNGGDGGNGKEENKTLNSDSNVGNAVGGDEVASGTGRGSVAGEITSEKPYVQLLSRTDSSIEDADEFLPDANEGVDDERTLEAEEKLGREMSYEEEISLLRREGEMSVDELRARYAIVDCDAGSMSVESSAAEEPSALIHSLNDQEDELKRKFDADGDTGNTNAKKARLDSEQEGSDAGKAALDVLEASAERARKTLASRPFLLAPWVKLREYQQTGLNWLVSLQSRRLNGILADEMGLGKTLQTIALLGYLASYKGIWGPHLVVCPTSVIINWETELKRFCPGLKVLCYYGSAKRRKELRTGWTKTNWYHVVITSYQLAVQDAFAFKRKRWYYLVLDEAQNIKNFQSQRWQTLINFNTQRRLLLTGTPLQNNLMELWSLLHFLMPFIFRSRKEFSYWFANPMNSMIEGTSSKNDDVISRLHGIIRPFVLRRLKKDVETQMPGKFESIVKCQLSRRQMFIYEEFLARSSTRNALKRGGNFMGMMNVLMQLRKVCNHPDLFEPRSVITPLISEPISISMPSCVLEVRDSSVFDTASKFIMKPLWSGSCGDPSIDAAMKHPQQNGRFPLQSES